MQGLFAVLVVVPALAAFFVAVTSGIQLLGRRSGGTVTDYLWHGIWFFDAGRFTPAARPVWRRFMISFGLFFLAIPIAAVIALVTG